MIFDLAFLISTFGVLVVATKFTIGDVVFDEPSLDPEVPFSIPRFTNNNSNELAYLTQSIRNLESNINETFMGLIQNKTPVTEDFIYETFVKQIDQRYFDIFLSLSLSKVETDLLLGFCNNISNTLVTLWKKVDPNRFIIKEGYGKANFQNIKTELELGKDLAVEKIFDITRHIGMSENIGKTMKKRLVEIEKVLKDTSSFEDPDYRFASTLHKFLNEVVRMFTDYNNLFIFPEGVMVSIEQQFQRKLQEFKKILMETNLENSNSKQLSDATSDARLVFSLLPLFRDPIGELSAETDTIMADIRKELMRLQMPYGDLELCFIKRMRIRFEKVWYSIDWVLQYVNFIYVQSGGKNGKPKIPEFSVAGYLFRFADWADLVFAWDIDSIESRLLSFTIRAVQNELESSEVFASVKLCNLGSKGE